MKAKLLFVFFVLSYFNCFAQDTLKLDNRYFVIDNMGCKKKQVKSRGSYVMGSYESILSVDSLIMGLIFYDRTGETDFPMYTNRNGEILAIVNYKFGISLKDTALQFNSNNDTINLKKITTYTEFIFPSKFLKAQLKGRVSEDSLLKIVYSTLYKYVPVSHGTIYEFNNFQVESFAKTNPPSYTNFIRTSRHESKGTKLISGKWRFDEKIIYYLEQYEFIHDLEFFIYIKKILKLSSQQLSHMYPDYWDQKNFELKVTKDWHRIANSDGIDEILKKYLK